MEKNKGGRPPMPKGTAKKKVLSVKLSDDDLKSLEKLLRSTGETKADFVRRIARSGVEQEKIKLLIASIICHDLREDEVRGEIEAILTADGLPPSIGKLLLDSALGEPGHYYPIEPDTLSKYPLRGAILKLSGRTERLLVKHIQRCETSSRPAYHIWFESVAD
jgi:hypothetical protein